MKKPSSSTALTPPLSNSSSSVPQCSSSSSFSSSRRVLDKPVAIALVSLAIVYSLITVVTYHHVTASDHATNHLVGQDSIHNNDPLYVLQHQSFPLHVQEWETIAHPAANNIRKDFFPPDLNVQKIKVPQFFDVAYAHVYGTGSRIRDFLGQRGEHLITPEQAAAIGTFTQDGKETIYASIASYRDPECAGTVADLFERAEYPERIRVAIVEQRLPDAIDTVCTEPPVPCLQDPNQALCRYKHLIDYYELDAHFGVGPVFARHLAHRHYRGEYYAMQIDSHVRFTEHWDTDIIGQWKSAKNEMAVLSVYPSDIAGSIDPVTHKSKHPDRPIMCASKFEDKGENRHMRHGQQPEGPPGIKGQPTLHPFWAAGFSFARGHFVIQVPYDQYLPMVFQGEEVSIGLRAFTHGYDFYAPERGVCFHMYAIKENKVRRQKVHKFWENGSLYKKAAAPAMKRLNSLIHLIDWPEEEWVQDEKDLYTLGRVRSVEKYFATFGIHVKEQTVEGHLCRFVGKPMMKIFLPALRSNRMGLDYDKIHYEFVDQWVNDKEAF